MESVSEMEGNSVTLKFDITEIYDVIQFAYKDYTIAEISRAGQNFTTYDVVLNGRFRNRLKVDIQTGSLTITNITTEHAGNYHIQMFNKRHTAHKSFMVNVCSK